MHKKRLHPCCRHINRRVRSDLQMWCENTPSLQHQKIRWSPQPVISNTCCWNTRRWRPSEDPLCRIFCIQCGCVGELDDHSLCVPWRFDEFASSKLRFTGMTHDAVSCTKFLRHLFVYYETRLICVFPSSARHVPFLLEMHGYMTNLRSKSSACCCIRALFLFRTGHLGVHFFKTRCQFLRSTSQHGLVREHGHCHAEHVFVYLLFLLHLGFGSVQGWRFFVLLHSFKHIFCGYDSATTGQQNAWKLWKRHTLVLQRERCKTVSSSCLNEKVARDVYIVQ